MDTKDTEAFDIEFLRAGRGDHPLERAMLYGLCPVTFGLERGKQKIEFTVYVDEAAHKSEDFIKIAQHQLHHDFAKLLEQTKQWDLPNVVISEKKMLDDGADLPF